MTRPQRRDDPGGLWSLLKIMERFSAFDYCDVSRRLGSLIFSIQDDQTEPWTDDNRQILADAFSGIADECAKVSLDLTVMALRRLVSRMGKFDVPVTMVQIKEDVKDVESRFFDEISLKSFFYVPNERARFYDGPSPAWGPAQDAFASIRFDLDEACKAYCLGRFTATAFHLMRMLEVAIAAVSRELGIDKHSPTWNAYLSNMEKAVDQKFPGHGEAKRKRDFYASVRAQLSAIKDAYRNPTMHQIARTYTEEEAQNLFLLVRVSLVELAKEVAE